MIDDSTNGMKVKGCVTLHKFLDEIPSILLDRTGLREVYENALLPCLMYLPTLTEVDDSLVLLGAAYPCLVRLADTWAAAAAAPSSEVTGHPRRLQALDRIMRDGVFTGYAHAGDNVRIADFLCKEIEELVRKMGIYVVKHLKVVPANSPCDADHLLKPMA